MKLGLYNAILHDRALPEAIDVIAGLGLTGIEINTGGFLPALHVPAMDDILTSDTARDDYLGIFEGTGVSIAGLNCNGNPLHPNPTVGTKHAEDIRRSIQLAQRLGQHRVVTMSGLPGGEPGSSGPIGLSMRGIQRPSMYSTTSGGSRRTSGARPTGSPAITTSKSPSSYIRRTSSSTARPSTNWSSWLAPPTSASNLTHRTCSGSRWIRSRWCGTSASSWSTPRPKTSASMPNTPP